jgi:CRISPR-associated endonuclease Csn1
MSKILGLDLGTNSIGWAIRETDSYERELFLSRYKPFLLNERSQDEILNLLKNEIVDFGVIVYKKGVGEEKNQEYSLAAERRKNRSKRRLYNAKRYRKWALLKLLVENKMCPLTPEELKLWSVGDWKKGDKNKGRIYPKNELWLKWHSMDKQFFGHNGLIEKNHEGKPSYIRKGPYEIRCELIEQYEKNEELRKYKIGRALYHLAQRRGFKTTRKSGNSGYAKNDEIEKIKSENSQLQLSQYINEKYFKQNQRFRASGVIQRKYYEEEFLAICKNQNIENELTEKLFDAIYYVRPLRTQKGLVGKCTMEPNKPRISLSHPLYEEFRALQFINNIQWRETGSNTEFKPIDIHLKKKIFEQLFFRKINKGNNVGKIDERNYFKFDEIVNEFSLNYKYEFNFSKYDETKRKEEDKYELITNPSVSVCPVIAGLMNAFEEEWKDKFIADENKVGINWDGLSLNYQLKYTTKKENGKGLKRKGKGFVEKEIGKHVNLNYEDIWHLLFDFIQTKDKAGDFEKNTANEKNTLKQFCKDVLNWTDEERIKQFCEIGIEQGYGSLSRNAISKILPYLQEGNIYTESVLYANLSKVLGEKYFSENKELIKKEIASIINEIDKQKQKLEIVNGLIQKYFGELGSIKKKGLDDVIKRIAQEDVVKKLKGFFGTTNWNKKSEEEQKEYYNFVFEMYLKFLDGKQLPEEKASSRQGKNPEIDYYKIPRLDDAIKQLLRDKFSATEKGLKHLYHPSDIHIYNPSTTKKNIIDKITGELIRVVPQLESPEPPSKGWKNPMAMRTMYELKHLINYLLQIGKIDAETKIVIEIAREMNDTNRRKALEYWKNDKEAENKEYAAAIADMFSNSNPSTDDLNKLKAAVEQIVEKEMTEVDKKRCNDFIETFLVKKNKKNEQQASENVEEEIVESKSYDYLLYLILNRENFVKLLYDQPLGAGRILNAAKDFKNKRKAVKEIITKYRLWKQQQFQCFYTGRQIPFADLMDGGKYRIEHTIPRSISFDSELKNITICDAVYNEQVKNNQFPKDCPNYHETKICKTIHGEIECSPIKDRVDRMITPKVVELKKRIGNLKAASKKIPSWEKDKKDANIRLRHYLQFELEYWEKKLLTFTIERKDWKDSWKNSQIVDTQIITKYARAYMKSVFNRVDVLKAKQYAEDTQGGMVNIFKKIYSITNNEKKDRTRHSHHAIDAAVLTLIPNAAKRDELLKDYYTSLENKSKEKFNEFPYPDFNREHIISIDQNVLINHISRNKTLIETKKKLRKRGKVQYSIIEELPKKFENKIEGKDYFRTTKDGKEFFKIPISIEGDSIRGQLHEETFLGAIKVAERRDGYAVKENGKFKLLQNKKGTDEILLVKRKPIKDIKINEVLDPLLRNHLQKQLDSGIPQEQLTDFAGKKIRHLRFEVFAPSFEKSLTLKKHSHLSSKEHKHFYHANNAAGSNEVCLYYTGVNKKQEPIFEYRFINLLEYSRLDKFDFFKNEEYNVFIKKERKDEYKLKLSEVFYKGDRIVLYKQSEDEINRKDFSKQHLFKVLKFNNSGSDYIFLQNHIEGRPDKELGDGDTVFKPEIYQARLKLTADKFKFLLEGKHFEIKPDGTINWKI